MEKAVGLKYSFEGKFVDLYINGDYMGNYYICPTLQICDERIDITSLEESMDKLYSKTDYKGFDVYETPTIKGWNLLEEVEDYTGGYLFEREFIERYETEYSENKSGFECPSGECFVIKSPKYCSKTQINYIARFVKEAEAAICAEDGINTDTGLSYNDYIDLDSFAKWYLVNEFTKNYDAGVSSAYYYKDSALVDDKIGMASGWDYDMSMGNYLEWMEYYNESAEGITRLNIADSSSNWYARLYEKQEFKNLVGQIYHEKLIPYIDNLLEKEITCYQNNLLNSSKMDAIRWKKMYENEEYIVGQEEAYESLKAFIKDRRDYFNLEW